MKVTIDPEADARYMRLSATRISDTGEVRPEIILDYDDRNNLVGTGILRVSKRVPAATLKSVLIESA